VKAHRAWLDPLTVAVEPGGEAACAVWITNQGTIPDQFGVEVLGAPVSWLAGEPRRISLGSGATGSITLTFRPPGGGAAPGPVPFAVHVVARSTGLETSVVEQGTLEVGRRAAVAAELRPRTSRGRLSGRHTVDVRNVGNAPSTVRLSGSDPEGALRLRLDPPSVTLEPGAEASASLRAWRSKPSLFGRPAPADFRVTVGAEGSPPVELRGTMVRRPLLGLWGWVAAGVLVLALAGGAALVHYHPYGPQPAAARQAAAPATPTRQPTSAPASAPAPAPLPQVAATATPAPACASSQGGQATPASITDVRAGAHAGYDSLVIQFDTAVPTYQLVPNADGVVFAGRAGGPPSTVAGSNGWQLLMIGLKGSDSYPHGTDVVADLRTLKEAKVLSDSGGSATLAIGLAGNACPRVSTANGPPRLVIDFPTQ
jgi:hypothetical protein